MHTLTPEFSFAGFTFPRYIADLPIGKAAMKRKRESRKVCGGYYHAPKPGGSGGWGFYDDNGGSGSPFNLRIERTGDAFGCDPEGCQTMEAIIVRLNHGRGFLVGWTMGDNMAASIDSDIFDDEDDARRCAKSRTEDAANAEYEYQVEQAEGIDA